MKRERYGKETERKWQQQKKQREKNDKKEKLKIENKKWPDLV